MSIVKFEFASDEARSLYDDKAPTKATEGSAAFDLRVMDTLQFPVQQKGFVKALSGVKVQIPPGMCGLLMPRSSLFEKTGCIIPNSPGLIDSDYRGEIRIPLQCISVQSVTIPKGTRVAQLLVTYAPKLTLMDGVLDDTERGENGFGSTGH